METAHFSYGKKTDWATSRGLAPAYCTLSDRLSNDCGGWQRQLVLPQKCGDPLPLPSVPKAAWLLTVYCRDVLASLDEVKASITATFGRVLKIDSTKKVYYSTAFSRVQITPKTSTNIPRYLYSRRPV